MNLVGLGEIYSRMILNGQKMVSCVAGVDLMSLQGTQKAFFGVTDQGGGDVAPCPWLSASLLELPC